MNGNFPRSNPISAWTHLEKRCLLSHRGTTVIMSAVAVNVDVQELSQHSHSHISIYSIHRTYSLANLSRIVALV